jgi:hypothetical protein
METAKLLPKRQTISKSFIKKMKVADNKKL